MGRSTATRSFAGVVAGAATLLAVTLPAGASTLPAGTEQAGGAQAAAVNLRTPFDCGQTWNANTRTNHNPQLAVDFQRSGAHGKTVRSSADGTVTKVRNLGDDSYGRYIEITHSGGWKTLYAHLSKQKVSEGQKVKTGSVIGNVGNTGGSSGAHLHYEQKKDGKVVKVVLNGVKIKYYGDTPVKSSTGC